MERRFFLQCLSGLGFGNLIPPGGFPSLSIPHRPLGNTGVSVSVLGMGTGDLYRSNREDSHRILSIAHESGITLFDTASAYGEGESETRLGNVLKPFRQHLFLSSKTLSRNQREASIDLEQSLTRLHTDHLDLWMIHDLRTEQEWDALTSRDGALEAFRIAKQKGLTQFAGFSTNRNPTLALKAIHSFPFDVIMLPVHHADREFITTVIPEAQRRGMGILGIRVLGLPKKKKRPQEEVSRSIHNALLQPISCAVTGCESFAQLAENIYCITGRKPFYS